MSGENLFNTTKLCLYTIVKQYIFTICHSKEILMIIAERTCQDKSFITKIEGQGCKISQGFAPGPN